MAFLLGHFSRSQLEWSMLEKEALAMLATTERLHRLLATPDGPDLFTDHQNFIFLLDPLAVVPNLSQTSLRKAVCWAIKLIVYNYTFVYTKGDDNI